MPFRALVFSKTSEINAAIAAACADAGIHAEVCSDIFTAIEKGKTRVYSCVIADWADQPEASFLLKRARESASNRDTVAIAIVDRNPTPAETRDSRLDFLIRRPVTAIDANAVLAKACEKMQPMTVEDARESFDQSRNAGTEVTDAAHVAADTHEHNPRLAPLAFPEAHHDETDNLTPDESGYQAEPAESRGAPALSFRALCAAVLVLVAGFLLWNSRDVVQYLSRTQEGRFQVLSEAVSAFLNKTAPLPPVAGGNDPQPDAYFNRDPRSNAQPPSLGVVATQSTLAEARLPLPKAFDFPLPQPVVERHEAPPVHVERKAIPESMRNSATIERPVVVTVNPAQMMPVSATQPAPQPMAQQFSEPVAVSEEAARALLIHSVDPAYPPEALPKKLHGPVVLQAVVGRDGSVQDLKIVRGYFVLGKAAIAAVKQWRFQPYSLNGHPAATQTFITVNFNYPPG